MFVDSHCHLDFQELSTNLDHYLAEMQKHQVVSALCVSVNLEDFPNVLGLAQREPHLFASVGVHPGYEHVTEPTVSQLVELTKSEKVVAIGETGLDYFHQPAIPSWQQGRFRVHIAAAKEAGLPLIVHTRAAAGDTLALLREEGQGKVNGVMHCFTESQAVARAALELGFYISFSGIVTFKTATELKEIAQYVPLDRILIETDSPYLAPVPYRGKTNQPAWVYYVAQCIAALRGISVDAVGQATTDNFFRLFSKSSLPLM